MYISDKAMLDAIGSGTRSTSALMREFYPDAREWMKHDYMVRIARKLKVMEAHGLVTREKRYNMNYWKVA